ncbi:IclR family transcriptional regulator [Pseudonocardia benzenivorans]
MEGNRQERPSWELTSVRNAARLLKEFSRTDRELGVSELARRLGLATSTVHRLLATLAAERLLDRGATPGSYRLGLAMFDLGAAVAPTPDLQEAALPVMAVLRQTTGETVQLAVLDGLESVYVDRLESPHTVRIFSRVGTRLPAPTTATGKTLLAALAPRDLDDRLREWRPERATPYSIVDVDTLRRGCARSPTAAGRRTARRAGWGWCRWPRRSGGRRRRHRRAVGGRTDDARDPVGPAPGAGGGRRRGRRAVAPARTRLRPGPVT